MIQNRLACPYLLSGGDPSRREVCRLCCLVPSRQVSDAGWRGNQTMDGETGTRKPEHGEWTSETRTRGNRFRIESLESNWPNYHNECETMMSPDEGQVWWHAQGSQETCSPPPKTPKPKHNDSQTWSWHWVYSFDCLGNERMLLSSIIKQQMLRFVKFHEAISIKSHHTVHNRLR